MTRLSNRQYPMLKIFAQNGTSWYMTLEVAQRYDQRPLRSMLIQEWISYRPGHGLHVTQAGLDAWDEFRGTKIMRIDPHGPLTRSLTDYYNLGDLGHKVRGAA